jgi:hypothetical protein
MKNIKQHLDLLGHKAVDRVTGYKGIVSSVCYDLYGCIQAALTPPVAKDGKPNEGRWFDVSRLKIEGKPVMERPNWDFGPVAEGKQGAAEKPNLWG